MGYRVPDQDGSSWPIPCFCIIIQVTAGKIFKVDCENTANQCTHELKVIKSQAQTIISHTNNDSSKKYSLCYEWAMTDICKCNCMNWATSLKLNTTLGPSHILRLEYRPSTKWITKTRLIGKAESLIGHNRTWWHFIRHLSAPRWFSRWHRCRPGTSWCPSFWQWWPVGSKRLKWQD